MKEYPFQTEEYRTLFKSHFIPAGSTCVNLSGVEYEITPDHRAVVVGMEKVLNGQELTDYGPLTFTSDVLTAHETLSKNFDVRSVQYDYIREDSEAYTILKSLSPADPTEQEVAPSITLPTSWDTYLESLERTDRKELKRKLRRLDTVNHSVEFSDPSRTEDVFGDFVRLHKLSDPAKDIFMTPPMERFFNDIYHLSIPQWKQHIALLKIEGVAASAVFFFESDDSVLLYNSGFDPLQKYYSVGLLLVARLIEHSIKNQKKTFDFLRGSERYKYDLGGQDCKLYRFTFSS